LGNARTFLVNWAMARQYGWQIVLRIDDLDGPRIKQGADRQSIDVLGWLGIDWDEGPHYQSHSLRNYRRALEQLAQSGQIYPCRCTRSEVLAVAQSAPHAGQHDVRYSGCCRPVTRVPTPTELLDDNSLAWRFRVADGERLLRDQFFGEYRANVQADVGDFLVATKLGTASYQLAVVIDDVDQRISCVVRGDDLLSSTPRQLLLYQALQLGPAPDYWHLPLVVGADGRRLAKRHGDSRLSHYRQAGVPAARIVGLLAEWCGVAPRCEMTAQQFLDHFDLARLPRDRVVFTADDDRWLLSAR
jgi:glutamyl-tRNA synthetase